MVPGLLAVLIAGHLVGSVEGGAGRGYQRFDPYYDEGAYAPYGGCGRAYVDCDGNRAYEYRYRSYSYRGYDDRYRGYAYGDED